MPYDSGTVADPRALRLYHDDKLLKSWIDVTTGVDTANHTVSGEVTSFFWFAAGSPRLVFGGFERPIDPGGTRVFKLGQTVPVKFQLTEASGRPVTNAVARIYVAKVVNGIPGVESPGASTKPKSDNTVRCSKPDHKYIFDLETRHLSSGVWQIRVMLDDGLSYVAVVSLLSKGGK